jgi:hypothetical protein
MNFAAQLTADVTRSRADPTAAGGITDCPKATSTIADLAASAAAPRGRRRAWDEWRRPYDLAHLAPWTVVATKMQMLSFHAVVTTYVIHLRLT